MGYVQDITARLEGDADFPCVFSKNAFKKGLVLFHFVESVCPKGKLGLKRPLLYARVDLVKDTQGHPVVLEMEIAEPSLSLPNCRGSATRFAQALKEMCREDELIGAAVHFFQHLFAEDLSIPSIYAVWR